MAPRRVPAAAPEPRLPGAPTPPSAAATAPMAGATGGAGGSGFYSPDTDATTGLGDVPAATGGDAGAAFRREAHHDGVALERGGTADVEVVGRLAAEASDGGETLAQAIERIRSTRKPLGAYSLKLALPQRAGYHRHWFNDVAGRIGEAQASGYAHIPDKDGKPICRAVGTGRDRGVQYAFAMEIPYVFYAEDMAAKHQVASDQLDALKKSPFRAPSGGAEKSDAGKFYDPVESAAGPLSIQKG